MQIACSSLNSPKVVAMKRVAVIVFALLLTACATLDPGRASGNTVRTPLNDFNLVATDIPDVLIEARRQPYAVPADASCAKLDTGIKELDAVLGADIDVARADGGPGDVVGDAATNAFQGMLDGLVPFRSWIRRLSGADQHARNVAAAIAAGTARRAFLKGLSQAHACPVKPVVKPVVKQCIPVSVACQRGDASACCD
jgi:hypothetical protein